MLRPETSYLVVAVGIEHRYTCLRGEIDTTPPSRIETISEFFLPRPAASFHPEASGFGGLWSVSPTPAFSQSFPGPGNSSWTSQAPDQLSFSAETRLRSGPLDLRDARPNPATVVY